MLTPRRIPDRIAGCVSIRFDWRAIEQIEDDKTRESVGVNVNRTEIFSATLATNRFSFFGKYKIVTQKQI
jgi:hypothetical protein